MTSSGCWGCRITGLLEGWGSSAAAVLLAVLFLAAPLAAQQDPTRPLLRGRVIDAETRAPLGGAIVLVAGTRRGVMTDSLGVFALPTEPAPGYPLSVEQLGYAIREVVLGPEATEEFTTILLPPNPIALEGLRVLVDRFDQRRRRYFGPVQVIRADRLLRTAAADAFQLVRGQVPMARPCPEAGDQLCFMRRGRRQQVRVCVDEVPAWGGATELAAYDPRELYMVEVYDQGRQIRVYTRWFVEQRLRSGRRLMPLGWSC